MALILLGEFGLTVYAFASLSIRLYTLWMLQSGYVVFVHMSNERGQKESNARNLFKNPTLH